MTANALRESDLSIARGIEVLTVAIITASALGLLTMRLRIFSAPAIWLCTAIITLVYSSVMLKRPVASYCAPKFWQMGLVVVVGLFFRLPPYTDVLGGTDNAAYINMGMELARTGALAPVDHVLERLQDPAIQNLYKSTSYQNSSTFLPGVYSTSDGLVFQFYPMFPVWLALFESGRGPSAAVYALTFLALVSLVYFQCIACLLTRSRRAGLAAGLLLAVNPLHAFVSKLTVSEMTLSAHALIAFFLLLVFSRASEQTDTPPTRLIWLSALALGLGFMTRINGFLYLPFLLTIFLSVMVFDDNVIRRKSVMWWAAASTGLYFVSAWYGLAYSAPYANEIYRLAFEPRFGEHWPFVLKIFGLLTLATVASCWIAIRWVERAGKLEALRRHITRGLAFLPCAIPIMLIVFLYKAYAVGFTDTYSNDEWVHGFWNMSHKEWASIHSTSLVVASIYLSPFICAAFLLANVRRILSAEQRLVQIFVIYFFCNYAVLLWFIGNYPAVHRYLSSEFVPGMLLVAVCAMEDRRPIRIRLTAILLLLGGVWCAVLSIWQLGKKEDDGALNSLNEIAATVQPEDVLLISAKKFPVTELQTPLTYISRLNVIRIDDVRLENPDYLASVQASYHQVYLLSDDDHSASGFAFAKTFRYAISAFTPGDFPPTTTVQRYDLPLRLDHLVSLADLNSVIRYAANRDRVLTQTGELEQGNLINRGKPGFLLFGPYKFLGRGRYHMQLTGRITQMPAGGFVRLDVVSDNGTTVHAQQLVTATGDLPALDFSLTQAASGIEVRLWAQPEVNVEIASYRVDRKPE